MRRTDPRLVVVSGCVVQRRALHVDRPQPEELPGRRVEEVREVGANLGDRRLGRRDVVESRRAEQVVVERVDEAQRVVVDLVGHRDHPRHQRGRQAGAADPVLIPVRPVREHLGLPDLEAGIRITRHRDVRHRTHRRAAVVLGDARRHLAGLVERLSEEHARPTAATGAVRAWRRGCPRPLAEGRVRVLPAVLVQPLTLVSDQHAGSADPGDVGQVGRELHRLRGQVGAAGRCGRPSRPTRS